MSLLRRALAGAAATTLLTGALVTGTAAPAAAESSTVCPRTSSTRLLTVNDGYIRLWLYQPDNSTAYLCFADYSEARGVLVIRGVGGPVVPSVQPDLDSASCDSWIHVQDPVDLQLRFAWAPFSSPGFVCLGIGTTAVRLDFTGPALTGTPGVELWLDRETNLGSTYCSLVKPGSDECNPWYNSTVRVI